MNSFKFATIVLAVGFAFGQGCGSDSGNSPDAPVIGGGTGGAVHPDAGGVGGALGTGGAVGAGGAIGVDAVTGAGGVTGTGGSSGIDAPLATGGTGGAKVDGGGVDASIADAPIGGAILEAGAGGETGSAGEAGVTTNQCTGLTAAACDQLIRNAPVDNTVNAQTVPNTNPPAFSACNQ